jgi:hypothetical protein
MIANQMDQPTSLNENAFQRNKIAAIPIIGVRISIGIKIARLFLGSSEINTDKPDSVQWRFEEAVKPSRISKMLQYGKFFL